MSSVGSGSATLCKTITIEWTDPHLMNPDPQPLCKTITREWTDVCSSLWSHNLILKHFLFENNKLLKIFTKSVCQCPVLRSPQPYELAILSALKIEFIILKRIFTFVLQWTVSGRTAFNPKFLLETFFIYSASLFRSNSL